ncbi:lactonase family protein [Kaarinaea lacus]
MLARLKQGCSRLSLQLAGYGLFWLLVLLPLSVSAAPRFVFAVNYIAGSISTFRVDVDTGMLHHIRHTPTLQNPSAMVLRPDGKYLYITAQSLDEISIYRVDQKSGVLTETRNSRVPSGVRSCFRLAMSPDGKLLYVPGRFSSNLMVFRSDPETGELTPLKENNFPTHGKRARFVEVAPDGRFVYVTNTVSGTIAAYRVDSDRETVTEIEGMPFRVGSETVRENSSGETIIGDSPQQVIVHPSGKFLYVPNWITGEMSGFRINQESGALTPIADFKAETGVFPFSGSIHPSGKYLYIANWLSWDISTYRIDEKSGRLTPLDKKPVSVIGETPVNVKLDAEGKFAYVPNYHHSTLTVFSVNDKTGQLENPRLLMTRPAIRRLSILEGEPVRYEPRWMVTMDYDKAANTTNVRSFTVDGQNGSPVSVDVMQVAGETKVISIQQEAGLLFAGQGKKLSVTRLSAKGKFSKSVNKDLELDGTIESLYVDQRGKHLYVATSSPARYLAYEITAGEGELKELERVELPEGTVPALITSSPDQRLNYLLDSANNRVFVFRFLTRFGPNMFQLAQHGSPFDMGDALADFTVDATGQFGLALSSNGIVDVYQLPYVWAPLKKLEKSALTIGKQPVSIVAHPGGSHVYILDAGSNQVHHLILDTSSGTLKRQDNAISLNAKPQAMIIDISGRFAYLRYASRKGLTRFEISHDTGELVSAREFLQEEQPSALAVISEIQ